MLRMRLLAANARVFLERALETLRRIQHHRIEVNSKPRGGITNLTDE